MAIPSKSSLSVNPPTRVAVSAAEAARLIGVSRAWIYLRIDDGTIPSVKIEGRRLIRIADLEELVLGSRDARDE